MLSWEKPLVKPMAPGSLFHYIESSSFPSTCQFLSPFILQSLLSNLYNKNTKNIYLIIFIRSHFCKRQWRDWQPLYHIGCKVLDLFVQVLGDLRVVSYWIDTLVLKNWGKYLRYFAASPFPLQGKTNACSRGSSGHCVWSFFGGDCVASRWSYKPTPV